MSVALVVALGTGTWWLLARDTRGAEVATVLALPVAILGLATAVIAAVGALREDDAQSKTLLSAARRLAGAVRAQESAALSRLLADTGDSLPANVAFAQPGLLYWRSDGGGHRGSLAQIESFYRELERGRLVVLGDAGAGKTVLAIQLIRDLAAAIVDTAPSPDGEHGKRLVVPIRLSLPAFDPLVGDEYLGDAAGEDLAKQLDQWVTGHLVTVYGLPEKVAAELVTGGWVLPVLDGLDEMDPIEQWPRRAAALVRAVNHPTAHGVRPVVLTCRTTRYAQLIGHPLVEGDDQPGAAGSVTVGEATSGESVVVQDATVVGMEPLSVRDVTAYLNYRFPDPADSGHCQPRWAPLLDRLAADRVGDPLVTALRSPLRLFLAITGYRLADSDPDVLTQCHTTAQIDDHLFGMLIPAVTAAHPRPTGGHYPAADVQRWLTMLARHLHRQAEAGGSGTDLRLDTLWTAAGDRAPRYLPAAVLTAAVLALLATSLQQFGLGWGFLPVVLVAAVVVAVTRTLWGSLQRPVDLKRVDLGMLRTITGRRRLARGLAVGLAFGLSVGLAFGFSVGFSFGQRLVFGLVVGLTFVLPSGVAFGLRVGLAARPVAVDLPHRVVSQGLAHLALELASGVVFGLMFGLAFGLALVVIIGLTIGVMVWPVFGIVVGFSLMFGLFVGLPLGISNTSSSPWPRYAVACLLLARRGDLPRRPAVLLDWAYNGGLMRLSGVAVQFRHREFQDWLTTHDDQLGRSRTVKVPLSRLLT